MRRLNRFIRLIDGQDVALALGAGCLGIGVGKIYWPAALIVIGCLLLFIAVMGTWKRGHT